LVILLLGVTFFLLIYSKLTFAEIILGTSMVNHMTPP